MMPIISGYVLADAAVTRWPHLRVLYTTGMILIPTIGAEPRLLHGEVLSKPYRAPQMISAVVRSPAQPRPSGDGGWMMSGSVETPAERLAKVERSELMFT